MTFLIEVDERNIPLHDFSFHLIQAIKHQNWLYNREEYSFVTSKELKNNKFLSKEELIPVGSLEFVWNSTSLILNKKPINIPEELADIEFVGRKFWVFKKEIIKDMKFPLFIKEAAVYKGEHPLILEKEKDLSYLNSYKDYFVSEVVPIKSEWRGFVFQGELKDVKPYFGDISFTPNLEKIRQMITKYSNKFPYTIDVLVNEQGTFLVEIHPFVSCGLYGFADYRILPQMFIGGFKYLQNGK